MPGPSGFCRIHRTSITVGIPTCDLSGKISQCKTADFSMGCSVNKQSPPWLILGLVPEGSLHHRAEIPGMKCPCPGASREPANVARSAFRGLSSQLRGTLQATKISGNTTNRLNEPRMRDIIERVEVHSTLKR